jgi:hypothetical protein
VPGERWSTASTARPSRKLKAWHHPSFRDDLKRGLKELTITALEPVSGNRGLGLHPPSARVCVMDSAEVTQEHG